LLLLLLLLMLYAVKSISSTIRSYPKSAEYRAPRIVKPCARN